MLRKLATLALAALTFACAPAVNPTPPQPTASALPIPPTPEVPDYIFHPSRMSPVLGTADVMVIVCGSRTTIISGYSWGVVWSYDAEAYEQCVARKTL